MVVILCSHMISLVSYNRTKNASKYRKKSYVIREGNQKNFNPDTDNSIQFK